KQTGYSEEDFHRECPCLLCNIGSEAIFSHPEPPRCWLCHCKFSQFGSSASASSLLLVKVLERGGISMAKSEEDSMQPPLSRRNVSSRKFLNYRRSHFKSTCADSAWMASCICACLPRAMDTGWLRQAVTAATPSKAVYSLTRGSQ